MSPDPNARPGSRPLRSWTKERRRFAVVSVALLALAGLLPAGCITIPMPTHSKVRQERQPIPLSPDKATLVLVRHSSWGPMFATVVDDQDRYYGTFQAKRYAFTQVEPGSYVFTSWSYGVPGSFSFDVRRIHAPSRVEAELAPGRVYYLLLRAWTSVGRQGVEVESLTPRRDEWEKLDAYLAAGYQLDVDFDAGPAAFDTQQAAQARPQAKAAFDALDVAKRNDHLLKRSDGSREVPAVQ